MEARRKRGRPKLAVIPGVKFNRLTIVREAASRGPKLRRFVVCRCECGVEREFSVYRVMGGRQVSCGCARRYRPFVGLDGKVAGLI